MRGVLTSAMLLAVGLPLSACADDGDPPRAEETSVSTDGSEPPTRADLRAATRVITAAADDHAWPLVALSHTEDLAAGLVIEIAEDAAPAGLEDEIDDLVAVPVAFEYVRGMPINRPAFD